MPDMCLREETEKSFTRIPREDKKFIEGYMTAVLNMKERRKKKRRPKTDGKETKST